MLDVTLHDQTNRIFIHVTIINRLDTHEHPDLRI